MPEYRTRVFELDDGIELPVRAVNARGWSAKLEGLRLSGPEKTVFKKAREAHYSGVIGFSAGKRSKGEFIFAPEVVLSAPNREKAQRALNTIGAAVAVYHAQILFDDFTAVPCDLEKPEGLSPYQIDSALGAAISTTGVWEAVGIAAALTRRTKWAFAAAKYFASLKVMSVHPMEHHPSDGFHYGVERDPVHLVMMGEAITLAFAAIEELGLQVKASQATPSKIDGKWNPIILQDLTDRLKAAKVNLDEDYNWMLRGTPRRIERRHRVPDGQKAPWTRRRVRDRKIQIWDAINYAGLLRSKAAAHASGTLTRSLTMVDVSNVQDLARRLVLECVGSWRS